MQEHELSPFGPAWRIGCSGAQERRPMLHYLTFSRELWRSNTSYHRAWRPDACQFATCDLHSNQEARSAVARVMANHGERFCGFKP
jgi:hypothetical protein